VLCRVTGCGQSVTIVLQHLAGFLASLAPPLFARIARQFAGNLPRFHALHVRAAHLRECVPGHVS
jgi:hypothetical protein